MIFFLIILYILPLFLIRPKFVFKSFSKQNIVGIPLFYICYGILAFYYIPLIINSSPNLGILENVVGFVRYQSKIDYVSFFSLIVACTSLSLIFFILGYLTPIKINNIYFQNNKKNLNKILLLFSIIIFLVQLFSIISFGPNYFKYLAEGSSDAFTSALQISIISVEILGIINGLNFSLKNPNKKIFFIFLISLILLFFRAKRLELLAAILPSFLAIQKRNIVKLNEKIKFLFPVFIIFLFGGLIGVTRGGGDLELQNIIFNVFAEPFLATQSFQGYLTLNNGEPRFLFINTLASFLALIPTTLFPSKWEYILGNGYYNNKELNINGANILLTGLYDDFGIIGIIGFSFLLGCLIRFADKSRFLINKISYISNNVNIQSIIYFSMPIIIIHFRDGYSMTLKYFIQISIFIFFVVSLSSKFKLLIKK